MPGGGFFYYFCPLFKLSMGIKSGIAKMWAKRRVKKIYHHARRPVASQNDTLNELIRQGAKTAFGKDHGLKPGMSVREFRRAVPIRDYEALRPYYDRIVKGEADVCWPGKPLYLAKTSGTTSGAKYIPITKPSIKSQIAAARDALFLYIQHSGNAAFLDGNMMFLSGSPVLETNAQGMKVGRLSGIVNHFVPNYLRRNQVPTTATNSIEDWEEKVDQILKEVVQKDLRLISGIPPWVQMLFERLEEEHGTAPLKKWPQLSVFVQGGVDFRPYKGIFERYFGDQVDIVEVYPASEGFLGLQDRTDIDGMLLNLDAGIYFEFIPLEEYGKENPTRLMLGEVDMDVNYAVAISTNAGLWGYDIGDTIKFVSQHPYRIKVTGRTKHFISAFGEHVIQEEVNKAMSAACQATGAKVAEFTVAPLISEVQGESRHEWLIEFAEMPADLTVFAREIDQSLRGQNSYYEDLRSGNMLDLPLIMLLQQNASREYMKSIGKLGGQNKFPRLSNHRKLAEALHAYLQSQATS